MWNYEFMSCPTCSMFRFPTHHILTFNKQWSLRYWMNWIAFGKLVSNNSICCSTHKIRSKLVGHPCEYIILPREHKTLTRSSIDVVFFMTFSTHVFCACHKHKNTLIFGQTLLHGKTISIRQCVPPATMAKTNWIHIEYMFVLLWRMYLGAMTQNMAMTMFYRGTFVTNVNCRLQCFFAFVHEIAMDT